MFEIESISLFIFYLLPRRLPYSRQHSFVGEFSEAYSAEIEIPHVAVAASTAKTSVFLPGAELHFLFASCND
jgi:hypothetical protein